MHEPENRVDARFAQPYLAPKTAMPAGSDHRVEIPFSKTNSHQAPGIVPFPAPIASAFSNSWRIPFGITEADVHSVTEGAILSSLAIQTSPSNRVAHLSILGAIGGDQTASRLVKMLLEEFAGQTLDDNDCAAIQNAIFALGCISPRSEVAREFLENATSESYWSQRRSWRSNNSVRFQDDQLNVQLAQESLIALGVGGQESAVLLAEQIRLSTAEEKARWASTVVDAMFYFDRAKIQKGPVLPEQGEDVANEFMRWATTEKGKYWRSWSRSSHEAEIPPRK